MPSPRAGTQCRFCDRIFHKGEHLRRHERSHTGAKPFVCHCGKAFSRQDSLLRHSKGVHNTRSDQLRSPLSPPPSSAEASADTPRESPITASRFQFEIHGNASDNSRGPLQHGEANDRLDYLKSSTDVNFDLIWPDTENLFQTIMNRSSTDFLDTTLGNIPTLPELIESEEDASGLLSTISDRASSIGIPMGGNHYAVHGASRLATGLTQGVSAVAEASSITSIFLDECLHLFFVKFIPVFPVLHRATFIFRDTIPPLLLNAIAIGSLYVGPKDAVKKGEILWRLAHAAVTSSWEKLIQHRGLHDACKGSQLITSTLLSQLYGALSKNRAIRTTSYSFHTLGISWARQCGMFDCSPYSLMDLPSIDASEVVIERQWRIWSAREVQQRSILGHYILDGLISRMSGRPTSVRHATNKLSLISPEIIFEANTATEWLTQMQSQYLPQATFRGLFSSMFKPSNTPHTDFTYSSFATRVLLEGLQSLVLDCADEIDDDSKVVGVPTKIEVRMALASVYEHISTSILLPHNEKQELLLRWHSICLDTYVDFARLCKILCLKYEMEQRLWPEDSGNSVEFDIIAWMKTSDARRALLHAIAIQQIVEDLPRSRAHAIHTPVCLFAAATVYTSFAFSGTASIKVPRMINWKETLLSDIDPSLISSEHSPQATESDTLRFIQFQTALQDSRPERTPIYELNNLQKLFRSLFSQWGIAYE